MFLLLPSFILAQNKYPTDYFIAPLDIELKLAGTFGELRSDHFHSGIDIKTGEVEGLEIRAIADGYVSRIKIRSGGYGNALYITHPNGYVSVYAHLQKFNETLKNYTNKAQYHNESFSVDLYPDKNKLKVVKGQIIAWSGNSGSSSGPHLHFEIREEISQKTVNPLLFGIDVRDNTIPIINMVKIYPFNNQSSINGKHKAFELFTKISGNSYVPVINDTIEVSGDIYFGINTFDPFNGGQNVNGVYSIMLLVDNYEIYSHNLEKFSFAETRYINSFIDYKEYKDKSRRVQKSYIQPNNRLGIYKDVVNRGIIHFKKSGIHLITYKVRDFKGNEAEFSFHVKSIFLKNTGHKEKTEAMLFNYTGQNKFETNDVKIEIPGKALYDTVYFKYKELTKTEDALTPVYQIHYENVPLHSSGKLAIKVSNIEPNLKAKALIAKIDNKGKPYYTGGVWNNEFLETSIRKFGNYCVMVDTIPPTISPLNIKNGKTLAKQNTIKLRIKDSFSGIKSFRGSLNGNWILMEYDVKRSLLTYRFDEKLTSGQNKFQLIVTDEMNNKTTYNANLIKQ